MTKWDERFLRMALQSCYWSKDRSTKVFCIIVGPDREIRSTGYNGMPRGVNDDIKERHERPMKYLYFEHAERNAIFNASRMGVPLLGCTLYVVSVPQSFPPCAECARAIIQAGIVRVVYGASEVPERWRNSCNAAMAMFNEARVVVESVDLNRLKD